MAEIVMNQYTLRHQWLYPAAAFLTTFIVYLLTLCPTVYVGDSGEFITNAYILGINHPTGYPLYTLLSRLAVLCLPWWSPATAVNLVSAFCASLTVIMLYGICRVFTPRRVLAFSCALLYGFSSTFWSRATTAEVYTLNALMVVLAVWFLLRWYHEADEGNRIRYLLALAYVLGLGLSQHVTGALVAVSVALVLVLKQPRLLLDVKMLFMVCAVAVLGFSMYLYLPVRSFSDPPLDWGNPESVNHLVGHFFPRATSALFGESAAGGFSGRLTWIVNQAFTKEFWYLGAFSLLGLFALSHQWRLTIFFFSAIGLNSYFTIIRKLPLHADFDAYLIPSYLMMAILICIGIEWVWNILLKRRQDRSAPVLHLVVPIVLLLLPLVLVLKHYDENDRSNNWFGYDFGINLLARVPPNAILFTIGDEQTFLAWYFKYVEKRRTDITVIDRNLLGAVWGGSHMFNRELNLPINEQDPPERIARKILEQMIHKRPIVFTPRLPWDFLTQDYDYWHNGMVIQLLPKGSTVPHYQPTLFEFHPNWTETVFDERCKLIVQFYYKEFIDNAKFWYNQGNKVAARTELENYFAFPYPKHAEDNGIAYLLLAQFSIDAHRLTEAAALLDSAAVYIPADWRLHELKGNVSFLLMDTSNAVHHWRVSLTYNPNNEKLQRNIEILTNPRYQLPIPQQPRPDNRPPRLNR
jgi:hypothetical protein